VICLDDDLIQKVYQYMMNHDMLAAGRHIIVGVSGGADSMCLLFVLLKLRERLNITLSVVHVNHGLRGSASDEDERFVESVCHEQGISFYSFSINISEYARQMSMSVEEAGRHYRYQCFKEVLKKVGADIIAVAHNRDDVGETVLLNIFRGTGIRGLKGIPAKREGIIRPLLCISRQEIEAFVDKHSIAYRTDETNFQKDYVRNRIRLKILPDAEEYINNQAKNHLYQLSVMATEVESFISEQTDNAYLATVKDNNKILIEAFLALHIVLKREVLRRVIASASEMLKDISFAHIEAVLELADRQVGKRVQLPNGLVAIRGYDYIEISASLSDDLKDFAMEPIDVDIPGEYDLPFINKSVSFTIKNLEKSERIPEKQYTKWFDYDKIKVGLKLRTRLQGDYLVINNGNNKQLTRLMIDQKIPKETRDQRILLADGPHVVWLLGDRISEAYKITPQTKRVLIVRISKTHLDESCTNAHRWEYKHEG